MLNENSMKADNETLRNRNVPLRRTNSSGNIANRLGPRRPTVGGAAQRIAKRKLERQRGRIGGNRRLATPGRSAGLNISRGRSRSRSRTRVQIENGRSRSRSHIRKVDILANNRNRSRNKNVNDAANTPIRRGRSRSRTRGRGGINNKSTLSVKARLGIRPGQNNNRRNASLTRRGVQSGRVEKRRNTTNTNGTRATVGNNTRRGRPRSRLVFKIFENIYEISII